MFSLASTKRNAVLSAAIAAGLWGFFWMPLRAVSDQGLTGAWATAGMTGLAGFIGLIYALLACRDAYFRGSWQLHLMGALAGLTLVLYSNALLYTDVVRAVLLFYLTPIWSVLLARIFLREAITGLRILSILLGFAGLLVIFGFGEKLSLPDNLGDWMAIASSVTWAFTAVILRKDETSAVSEQTVAFVISAALFGIAMLWLPQTSSASLPAFSAWTNALAYLLLLVIVFLIPSLALIVWSCRLLSPGLIGILFMTEISVASVTAALFAGEPFGLREITGVLIITSAGVIGSMAPLRLIPEKPVIGKT